MTYFSNAHFVFYPQKRSLCWAEIWEQYVYFLFIFLAANSILISTFHAYFEWQCVKDTMNIMSTHQCSWPVRIQDHPDKGSINKAPFSRGSEFLNVGYHAKKYGHSARKCRPIFASSVSNSMDPSDSDDTDKKKPQNGEMGGVRSILSFLLLDQFIFMSKWFSNWIISTLSVLRIIH